MKPFPTIDQIRQWIIDNPGLTGKRDIANAFGIKGDARIDLKRLLRELDADAASGIEKRGRHVRAERSLPPVSVLLVLPPDAAGDLFAKPMEYDAGDDTPRILIVPQKGDPALGAGERILARLTPVGGEDHAYEARLIRRIGSNPTKLLGIFRAGSDGGRIAPIDKGADKEWSVSRDYMGGALDGELVEAEQIGAKRLGLPQASITARLGDPSGPRAVSLIAIHQHGIPDQFPEGSRAHPQK